MRRPALLAVALAAACAAEAEPDAPGHAPAAGGKADRLDGAVVANHCEIFVDKAVPLIDSHGFRGLRLYAKVLPARLDGAIAEVGFVGHVEDPEGACAREPAPRGCEVVGPAVELTAPAFLGAPDYFELDLVIDHDFTFEHRFVGEPRVVTAAGTDLRLVAPDGGPLVLDRFGHGRLQEDLRGIGYDDFFTPVDVGAIPTTAGFYPYLNRDRCR
jgi:hypothetical protein